MENKPSPHYERQDETILGTLNYLINPPAAIRLNRWGYFNEFVGGFRMREFSILCGPTGCGKTTFLANVSAQLIEQKVKHFVMSIETGRHDYMARVLSVWAGKDLNTGDSLSRVEAEKVLAAHADKWNGNTIDFSMYEARVDLERLKYEISHAVVERGCKIVFVDNLNFLLKVTRASDQIVEMDRVIHDLIEFVKTIDVHIVMVMHPRKTEGGRVESEYDIKGSSTAVQEAQNVFLLNPPPKSNKEASSSDRELFIAKMRRRGMFRGRTICLGLKESRYVETGYL